MTPIDPPPATLFINNNTCRTNSFSAAQLVLNVVSPAKRLTLGRKLKFVYLLNTFRLKF